MCLFNVAFIPRLLVSAYRAQYFSESRIEGSEHLALVAPYSPDVVIENAQGSLPRTLKPEC